MGNTFDFDMMLSSAREAYGEELYKMACEGLDFVFTYSDNVAPSSSAGKLLREFPERCFNMGIAEPDQVGASAGLALAGCTVFSQVFGPFLPLRAADQIHTLFRREHGAFFTVVHHTDDQPVKAPGGPGDDVEVTVRDRIEAAGINGCFHASSRRLSLMASSKACTI